MTAPARPGVLLCVGDYHGTLAAVRSLGGAGVEVTVADWRRLVAARWSRWATNRVTCPDPGADPGGFIAWLIEEGVRAPGRALLPTTDELAWLFARHAKALAPWYRLEAAPLEGIYALLNKVRLAEACARVGLMSPATCLFESEAALPSTLQYPLVVKPQTQVLLSPHQKGRVVERAEQLVPAVRDFLAATRHRPELLELDPGVGRPMLQAYLPAAHGVYSVTGFIDATGGTYLTRACRKVFQRPRKLGIGLCFEAAEVDAGIAERVKALCLSVGYRGVFEAELLETAGGPLLIDFNPRFYGQVALDVARGLDQPLLAYLQAIGDGEGLAAAAGAMKAAAEGAPDAWCDRVHLALFLASIRATGAKGADGRRWRRWLAAHREGLADPLIDRSDLLPAAVVGLTSLALSVRHPRATYRAARER